MKIKPHHKAAVQILVAEQFEGHTQEQLAAKMGVRARTLYTWLQDPAFRAVLAEAQAEWRADIDHLPYVHRRKRLEKLHEILDALPNDYIDKSVELVLPNKITGSMESHTIPVRKSNALAQAKLLEQIALEVGGDIAAEFEALKIAMGLAGGQASLRVAARGSDED